MKTQITNLQGFLRSNPDFSDSQITEEFLDLAAAVLTAFRDQVITKERVRANFKVTKDFANKKSYIKLGHIILKIQWPESLQTRKAMGIDTIVSYYVWINGQEGTHTYFRLAEAEFEACKAAIAKLQLKANNFGAKNV